MDCFSLLVFFFSPLKLLMFNFGNKNCICSLTDEEMARGLTLVFLCLAGRLAAFSCPWKQEVSSVSSEGFGEASAAGGPAL